MNVLITAYDCNPYIGSDSYVGWQYCIHMAKLNRVFVLTNADNKSAITRFYSENKPLEGGNEEIGKPEFLYIKNSGFFRRFIYRFNKTLGVLGAYVLWQIPAFFAARKLSRKVKIDICHHVSIADFRCAGYLWKLNAPFVFGPVGGGQETPACLKKYIAGYETMERLRSFLNKFLTLTPNYKKALKKAAVIYCSNDETIEYILKRIKNNQASKVRQMTELAICGTGTAQGAVIKNSKVVHIMVCGRLIYRKGISLFLDVINAIHTSVPYVADIYGDGDQKSEYEQKIADLKLDNRVKLHGRVGFDDIQEKYQKADIFVLPSLRETTGTSVFEAMSNQLPVVALRQNGVKYVVGDDAGILVDVISREQIICDMALALQKLIEDKDLRKSLGKRGYEKVSGRTWNQRAKEMDTVYRALLHR